MVMPKESQLFSKWIGGIKNPVQPPRLQIFSSSGIKSRFTEDGLNLLEILTLLLRRNQRIQRLS